MSADHDPSQDATSVMRGMSIEELKVACEEGSQAACEELDRRGVEPDMLEPVSPIHAESYDIAREGRPNPNWLRQQAATMKLEASLLRGHAEAYAGEFVAAPLGSKEEDRALALAVNCGETAASLENAAGAVEALVARLDPTGPKYERRGDADRPPRDVTAR